MNFVLNITKNRKNRKRRNSSHAAINYKGKILNEKTPFAVAEAFKTLRTNLLYMVNNQKCPVFGVVSSYQNTGKSLISANLAVAFSMMNKRVLLVDGDMRKPVQSRCFGIKHTFGLSELLSGQCSVDEAITTAEAYPNLSIILSGNIPPNPQELLAYETTKGVFDELKSRFDVIVVDLPPVGVVSDAITLSTIVTGFIFVVRSGESDGPSVIETVNNMSQMNCVILGTVLNGYDLKTDNYYRDRKHGKYSYYHRYNGETGYNEAEENNEENTEDKTGK